MLTENEIGTIVVESAIKVHQKLGPGLLESVYEAWNYTSSKWVRGMNLLQRVWDNCTNLLNNSKKSLRLCVSARVFFMRTNKK